MLKKISLLFVTLITTLMIAFTFSSTKANAQIINDWYEKTDGYTYHSFDGTENQDGVYGVIFEELVMYNFTVPYGSTTVQYYDASISSWVDWNLGVSSSSLFYDGTYIMFDGQAEFEFGLGDDIGIRTLTVTTNQVPILNGETAFVTNVDMPMSETEIRSHITAIDNEDGNITGSIVLVSDNYTPNKTTKGSWIINYSVSDSAGNSTTLAVTVLVKDVTKPIITGTSSYTQSMTTLKSLDTIKASLSATDNYDPTASVVLVNDGYSTKYNIPGTYNITFKSTDTSGNVGNYTVVVTVVDDVKPTISGPTTIVKGQTETLTTNEIKAQLTANDNLDGIITGSIVVVTDNYVGHGHQTGSYTIVFGVTDASGNTIQKTVTITVMDNIPPIFYVDNYFITIDQSLVITQAEIIDLLTRTGQISVTAQTTVTTTLNEYSGNENQVGMYAMTFKAASVDGNEQEISVVVNVTGTEDPGVVLDPVDDSVSWWQAIINFFIWIWKNIFVKPFNWVIDLF